jgi:undecaprenyl-diphosphatase
MSVVHLVGDCGGLYGFASSHAANSFALATMIYLFSKNTGIKSWFLFLWAAIVSYSRIYVGVHFLSDVIVGAMVGIFFSKLIFNISKKYSFIN